MSQNTTLEALIYNREARLRSQLKKEHTLVLRARLDEILLMKRKLKELNPDSILWRKRQILSEGDK